MGAQHGHAGSRRKALHRGENGTRERPPNPKWNFAIGTTSRVPGRPTYHYLIVDIDKRGIFHHNLRYFRTLGATLIILQPTPSGGWHIYTDLIYSWRNLFHVMPTFADEKWLQIGKKRGYLFLADKTQVNFPWPVERMVLYYNGKKERHSA
jgi:hypothetical protein